MNQSSLLIHIIITLYHTTNPNTTKKINTLYMSTDRTTERLGITGGRNGRRLDGWCHFSFHGGAGVVIHDSGEETI